MEDQEPPAAARPEGGGGPVGPGRVGTPGAEQSHASVAGVSSGAVPGRPSPAGRKGIVVARTREELAAAEAARARKKALPSFLVAAVLHVVALWWLHTQVILPALQDDGRLIEADLSDEQPLEPEEQAPPPEQIEPPPEPESDVPLIEDPLPRSEAPPDDVLGVGGSGGMGTGTAIYASAGIEGVVPSGLSGAGLGTPFHRFVSDMRERGLDVVFVVDATGSMQRFIDRAQETIGRIMSDLSAVVPSLRLGLVAYRDLDDPWTIRVKDLTDDRWSVHTFLLSLEASGGKRVTPDFEEAVEVGLATAADQLDWRPDARRVMILVGDAPYHDEDKSAALATVRSFARDEHSLLNTIYVGAGDQARATENQSHAREALQLLARTGGGKAFELVADDPGADEALRERVSEATFGSEFKSEIAAFIARVPRDARLASVRRHVAAKDRKWIARRLTDATVHPGVVDGAIELFDPTLAQACLQILEDERRPVVSRSACLFVLMRSMETLDGLELDTHRPLAEQQDALAAVRRRVEALQRGGVTAPPPPPPARR